MRIIIDERNRDDRRRRSESLSSFGSANGLPFIIGRKMLSHCRKRDRRAPCRDIITRLQHVRVSFQVESSRVAQSSSPLPFFPPFARLSPVLLKSSPPSRAKGEKKNAMGTQPALLSNE